MKAASRPRTNRERKLLYLDATRRQVTHHSARDLNSLFERGDLLVVNDAATLPASLFTRERNIEVRLAARESDDTFVAVLFGRGDYHTPTELRAAPPSLAVGERLYFEQGLEAEITQVHEHNSRLVTLRFNCQGPLLLRQLYAQGSPIQYAHVPEQLALWDVQNLYAGRPWAFEAPSAGFSLDGEQLLALAATGVEVAYLTHGAGISSTGNDELDSLLPLTERYEIPERTCQAVADCKRRRGRVIAAGTSVVRALESAASAANDSESAPSFGAVRSGPGTTTLRIGSGYARRVVDGILSGMHSLGTSHFQLLESFVERAVLLDALGAAEAAEYLEHEFGDVCLVLASETRNRPPEQRGVSGAAL